MGGVNFVFWVRCRSRRDKFNSAVATETCRIRGKKVRCGEPSRIPRIEPEQLFRKSRKLRRTVRRAVAKNFPKSSRIHSYVRVLELNEIKTF